jgi:hypothetical protein
MNIIMAALVLCFVTCPGLGTTPSVSVSRASTPRKRVWSKTAANSHASPKRVRQCTLDRRVHIPAQCPLGQAKAYTPRAYELSARAVQAVSSFCGHVNL